MEKICPYCDETYQTIHANQISCDKSDCKYQHEAKRTMIKRLKRQGKDIIEDLEDWDRGTFSGFYMYMKKRPYYFQELSSMLPTSQNIKEYFYDSL